MAIDITLLANVKGFLRGTKDASEALEDVSYDLDRLAKDGDDSIDRLEGKFKQLAKQADKTGEDIGDGVTKGTKRSEDGLNDLNQNAQSNAKEVGASFDGSIESIADGFQGLAAEAFEGWGPAGIVAGVALAAGIGLASKGFEDAEEEAQKLRDKVGELTQQFIETGEIGKASLENYIDAIKELATETDIAEVSLKDLSDASGGNIETLQDMAEAIGGVTDNYDDLIIQNNKELEALHGLIAASKQIGSEYGDRTAELIDQREALYDTNEALEQQRDATIEAAEAQKAANDIGLPALEARAEMINMVDAAYDEAASSAVDFIDQETGIFNVEAYIASMQEREKALQDYQTALASSGLTSEAKEFLNSQGAEAAALMLEGYASNDSATKAELNRIWTEAGQEGSGAADKAIEKTFQTPYEAKIEGKTDLKKAEKDLEDFAKKNREIRIKAIMVDRNGKALD